MLSNGYIGYGLGLTASFEVLLPVAVPRWRRPAVIATTTIVAVLAVLGWQYRPIFRYIQSPPDMDHIQQTNKQSRLPGWQEAIRVVGVSPAPGQAAEQAIDPLNDDAGDLRGSSLRAAMPRWSRPRRFSTAT